ncbi:MAG: DUF3034 family protein [Candidatus Omnitrophica bacterium]|nr:DUF3034 family protein [Candidatus Omnitrophota bacterium]
MKSKSIIQTVVAGVVLLVGVSTAHAGVPLNNVEGVGGIAFNPLAYTAGTPFDDKDKATGIGVLKDAINKPQFGIWRIRLNKAKADWTTESVATTLFGRLETSYGSETVSVNGFDGIHKQNLGLKGLLVKENSFDTKWIPAVAVGVIDKETSYKGAADKSDQDYYAVATKLITQLPLPVLVSGGVRSTKGIATGVLGFGTKRDTVGFGNVDVILPWNVAVGYEYEQGANVGSTASTKNADYYDIHAAWLANKNLTLVAAYVNTGKDSLHNTTSKFGLGDGFVLSANYAF